jgi:hypothetical protein
MENGYALPNIIRVIDRKMRRAGNAARMGKIINAYSILVRQPKGKRQLRRSSRRWENNIKTDLREIEWEIMDWNHLTQERDEWRAVVNIVMNLWVRKMRGIS